jgi:hypothetical protein
MSTPYDGGGYSPNPAAVSKVSTVGLAMQIVGGVAVAIELLGLIIQVLQLAGISLGGMSRFSQPSGGGEAAERFGALMGGGIGIVILLFFLGLNAFVIFAGQKMKALESYTLVMIGAILLILPVSCGCCCIGNLFRIPVGIWALVTLLDSEVKSSFRS